MTILPLVHHCVLASVPLIWGLHLDTSLRDFMQGAGIFSVFAGGWILMAEMMDFSAKQRKRRRSRPAQGQIRSLSQLRLQSWAIEILAGAFLFVIGIALIVVGAL